MVSGSTLLAADRAPIQGVKRTYGKSRSFLVDEDDPLTSLTNGAPSSTMNTLRDKMRVSYGELRKRWGVDLDEEEVEAEELQASPRAFGSFSVESFDPIYAQDSQNGMSTIVELRTQGENRRFADELSYLLEGLSEGEPIGVRRTRYVLRFTFVGH
jgi:Wings apart-like protein regulation of heterochromatin